MHDRQDPWSALSSEAELAALMAERRSLDAQIARLEAEGTHHWRRLR